MQPNPKIVVDLQFGQINLLADHIKGEISQEHFDLLQDARMVYLLPRVRISWSEKTGQSDK